MKSLRNEQCRQELIQRINSLSPDAKATWGKMNVEQMLSHLVQSCELPFEATVPDQSNWMSRNVIKPLAFYLLPIPKEVKTSPEIDQQAKGRPPLGFETDKALVIESLQKVGAIAADHKCLDHPFFGPMSANDWCRLGYKHVDHHLRQFGA